MPENAIVTQSGKPESRKFTIVDKLDFHAAGGTPQKSGGRITDFRNDEMCRTVVMVSLSAVFAFGGPCYAAVVEINGYFADRFIFAAAVTYNYQILHQFQDMVELSRQLGCSR